jgi:hypothetical protein
LRCCRFSPFDEGTGRDHRRLSAVFLSDQKVGREQHLHSKKNTCLSFLPISNPFITASVHGHQTSNRTQLSFIHPTLTSCGPWFVQMNRIFLDEPSFSRACYMYAAAIPPPLLVQVPPVGQSPPLPKCHSILRSLICGNKTKGLLIVFVSCSCTVGVY